MHNPGGAVAIANYDFRSSGTVAKSIQIAVAARAKGLPVELWCVRAEGPLLARVPANIPVVAVGSRHLRLRKRLPDLIGSTRSIAHALRQRQPAVFLSGGNHFHVFAQAAIRLSGQRDRIRFGLRVSNSLVHQAGDFTAALLNPFIRLKYAGADFLVAVSQDLAAEMRSVMPSAGVESIPNGCDIAAVRAAAREPADHPFFARGPVITTMGRIARQKGFDVLIRALALLRRDVDARLLVIGTGSASRTRELRELAAKEGVAEQVDFTGFMANPFPLVARSQLYVCASRWEGASNALIEALACDVPIVATDCRTGNAEILLGGELGSLAPPESVAGLAEAIRRELQAVRAPQPRAEQLARLDIDRCLESWCGLLQREYALSGRRGGAVLQPAAADQGVGLRASR
jgi:glycosyltransferase involved in cell wall biosynthesis